VIGRRVGWRVVVGIAAVVLSAGGCGGGQSAPVEQQPQLAGLLTHVDDEITAGHFVRARQSLNALVAATESARGTGTLDVASAERVLSAAADLKTQLRASIDERRAAVTPEEPATSDDPGNSGPGGGDGHNGPGAGNPDKPEPKPDKPDKPDHPKPDKGR
jgi:hypothetical protein